MIALSFGKIMGSPSISEQYEALCEGGKALFRRLSVFQGGCTRQALGAVCAFGPLCTSEIDPLLDDLVAKSLVAFDPVAGRYQIPEHCLPDARNALRSSSEEPETTASLIRWCRSLAVLTSGNVHGADQASWLHRIDTEYENIASVLSYKNVDPAVLLEIGVSISRYWMIRGRYEEGAQILRSLKASCQIEGNETLIGKTLVGIGNLNWLMGNASAARECFVHAAESGLTGDAEVLAPALNGLGNILASEGRFEEARRAYVEACTINCLAGNRALEAMNLSNVGKTFLHAGDLDNAEDYYKESEAVNTEIGNVAGLLHSYQVLGLIAYTRGDMQSALECLIISLRHSQEIEERAIAILCTGLVGAIAQKKGDYERACSLFALALRLAREIEYEIEPFVQAQIDAGLALCQSALDEESIHTHWSTLVEITWPSVYETVIEYANAITV